MKNSGKELELDSDSGSIEDISADWDDIEDTLPLEDSSTEPTDEIADDGADVGRRSTDSKGLPIDSADVDNRVIDGVNEVGVNVVDSVVRDGRVDKPLVNGSVVVRGSAQASTFRLCIPGFAIVTGMKSICINFPYLPMKLIIIVSGDISTGY